MSNEPLFSKYYSDDRAIHEDKPKFRNRILRYLEDFMRKGWPQDTYQRCRIEMGIDIKYEEKDRRIIYHVVETFNKPDVPVSQILDFISVLHDSLLPHQDKNLMQSNLIEYIKEINRIFQEESMCYVLNENGRVRYSPDDQFSQLVKATLVSLGKPKYQENLKAFNSVLDESYRNSGKESPIRDLFHCLEVFTLSMLGDKKYIKLDQPTIDTLLKRIIDESKNDSVVNDNDRDALSNMGNVFFKWVTMCHKYRHGKADQTDNDVPMFLFNYIMSQGISIFRFLLEVDDEYLFIKNKT